MQRRAVRLFKAAVGICFLNRIGREKLIQRELDLAEHRAGILFPAAIARLVRHAVIVGRNEQLRVPDE